jgi:hypothetical protein
VKPDFVDRRGTLLSKTPLPEGDDYWVVVQIGNHAPGAPEELPRLVSRRNLRRLQTRRICLHVQRDRKRAQARQGKVNSRQTTPMFIYVACARPRRGVVILEGTTSPDFSHRGSGPQPKDGGTPRVFGRL